MYTREQVIEKSTEYFEGDVLAATVFADKYALCDLESNYFELTPDDMHRRLAKEFARIESKYPNPMSEEEIYEGMKNFEYIVPQGSPMAAIGNEYQIQSTSNCFVIGSPEDSYGGICKTDQELVQLAKRRSGIGFNISNIRPKGVITKNAAKTTDGISIFMDRFSNSCKEVAQNSRRGALILVLDIRHPEVETFINIKKDKTRVTGANISVVINDEFMNAVKNDEEYEQKWPIDSETPTISKKVKARYIWNQIIHNAWESAEPGLLFWGNVEKNTPSDVYKEFKSIATNPCQPFSTKVLTKIGIKELGEININDEIWSKEGWTKVLNKWSSGIKDVYKASTNIGDFYSTENHKIVSNGIKVELKDAKTIDMCLGDFNINSKSIDLQDVMDGLVFGDGSVHKASNDLVYFIVGENDKDYFNHPIKDYFIKARPGIKPGSYEVKTTITSNELPKTFERKISERFLKGTPNKVIGFLLGLFSANGSISGQRVCLKASSFEVIKDVMLMLSSIGIRSYYTTNKSKSQKFSNGTYIMKESYDINITTDRNKFYDMIGFIQQYKMDKLKSIIDSIKPACKKNKTSYEIKSYTKHSTEEVFDITVDNNSHTFWSYGFDTSNCGEIVLSKNDSCRLVTMNLLSFVENKFKENAEFNFDKFSTYVYKAQKMMDDLIDLELESVDKIINKIITDPENDDTKMIELNLWKDIRNTCEKGRRTGLGITALGDALAAIGIRYGSKESINMTEEIYKSLCLNSYKASIDMAKDRGSFSVFDYEKEKDHEYLSRIISNLSDEYKEAYKKYGRRNIALTTTAPTGSVSLLTRTTSGIEPVFKISYKRRKKVSNINDRVDFVDVVGDKWQEYKVYHNQFNVWSKITGKTLEEESPWFKATSEDVDWEGSVYLQAAAQKWVDHSISKTCNLPNDATEDIVANVYMKAWESGCKGFTVYRDGCRDGVLISDKVQVNNKFSENNAPKRPENLKCEIHQVKIKGESWTIMVGLFEDKPYEIFGGKSQYVSIPKKIKTGELIKHPKKKESNKSVYDLKFGETEDPTIIKDVAKVFENPTEGEFTRIISLSLRHGAPVVHVVEQLQKEENSDMYSFSRVVARVLKGYIKEGTVTSSKCPNCGAKIVFVEGCKKCSENCGYSACS